MKYLYLFLVCTLSLGACTKLPIRSPQFGVTTAKLTYKVGDTVKFVFNGNPDNITFYSGEGGLNYANANRSSATGIPQLQFTTYLQNPGEANTLRLMASTDFTGTLDATNVTAATWTDITSRAVLSTGADNTASGIVDLSDFLASGKPLYLAFRYLGVVNATLKQPAWTVRTFTVNNVLPDKTAAITTIDIVGWKAVDLKNTTVFWNINLTGLGQLYINGTATGSTNADNEDWAISKPINLRLVTPDVGVPLKNVSASTLTGYNYKYLKAGTYTATFLVSNVNQNEVKSETRQIQLTITP